MSLIKIDFLDGKSSLILLVFARYNYPVCLGTRPASIYFLYARIVLFATLFLVSTFAFWLNLIQRQHPRQLNDPTEDNPSCRTCGILIKQPASISSLRSTSDSLDPSALTTVSLAPMSVFFRTQLGSETISAAAANLQATSCFSIFGAGKYGLALHDPTPIWVLKFTALQGKLVARRKDRKAPGGRKPYGDFTNNSPARQSFVLSPRPRA